MGWKRRVEDDALDLNNVSLAGQANPSNPTLSGQRKLHSRPKPGWFARYYVCVFGGEKERPVHERDQSKWLQSPECPTHRHRRPRRVVETREATSFER